MHRLPRFLGNRKQKNGSDPSKARGKPRLDRCNAVKYFEYDAGTSSSSLDDSHGTLYGPSMEFYDRTSFRIGGIEGELDLIYRGLGLSGPEDFAIPAEAWEAMKIRSSSATTPSSKLNSQDNVLKEVSQVVCESGDEFEERVTIRGVVESIEDEPAQTSGCCVANGGVCGGGIKGVRPPMLKPPPGARLPVIDNTCSTWDLFRGFAPIDERQSLENYRELNSSNDVEVVRRETWQQQVQKEEDARVVEGRVGQRGEQDDNVTRIAEIAAALSASCSFTTSNEDDSSSTTTDPHSNNISPNGRFRRIITNWEKGELLGRGTFGSVYEGISE